MVETERARDLPHAILALPQRDKLCFAGANVSFGMEEAVRADFDGAVAFHVVGLQRAGYQFAAHIRAANVLLDAVDERLFAERDTALVMIKLDIVGNKRSKFLQVAAIVGIEQRGIECGYGFVELSLILDVVERLDG